jgi:adenosylmethionine-8-amino-7-oxononanoate aminotransferase
MTSDADLIKYLWTHKTQDHPFLSDEELLIERGEGVYVWTKSGKRILDAFSGLCVVNAGHGRREIVEAVAEQMSRLAYYPTHRQFSNRPAIELAAKLASLTPSDLKYTFFSVSGSEANERSMQIARHYWLRTGKPEKHKVISMEGGYHGGTIAAFSVCGIPEMAKPYEPLQVAGFAKVAAPYAFLDRGDGTDADLVERCGSALAEAIVREDPKTVSAVLIEAVQSSAGFVVPPAGWLRKVRAVCDELDVLMIADEIITGFGRTGRWFGCDHDDVAPDLMSLAKGITSGYVPLGASIARPRLADAFPEDSKVANVHATTYAGHPVACAAALANIAVLEKENLVTNAAIMGERLVESLRTGLRGCPIVGEVRGRGLMVCIDFVQQDGSRRALDSQLIERLNTTAWRRGAIVFAAGRALRLAPPLCIKRSEIEELAAIATDIVGELADQVSRAHH